MHPGHIEDSSPFYVGWDAPRGAADPLTDRDVVETILFVLGQPPNVAIRSLVIERQQTEFLT